MIYVFVFQGEFGYELLNWQGVVRRFARTLAPGDQIICCSRANLYPLYECAAEFVDISQVPLFRRSRASCYRGIFAYVWVDRRHLLSYAQEKLMKVQLKRHILAHSTILGRLELPAWFSQGLPLLDPAGCTFVFSADTTRINGCVFGYARTDQQLDVYELLDVANNEYRRIEPDLSVQDAVEAQLGWSLSEPFVLLQDRRRDKRTRQLSTDTFDRGPLLEALSRETRTVLLSFDTGRWMDSYSHFEGQANSSHYTCRTFPEQACLIHFARHCLLFSEGDFGSHIYVPPFMGRDVLVVAPRSVYQVGSTPIDFWNRELFRFGGQVMPRVAEEVCASPSTVRGLVDEMRERLHG